MLHAKFQDQRTSGSGEDFIVYFFYISPYNGMAAILAI